MTFLSFLVGIGMLGWSGWGIGGHVLPRSEHGLRLSLALPFGALMHVLLLAKLTILGVPLLGWLLLVLHVVVGFVAWFVPVRFQPAAFPIIPQQLVRRGETILRTVLCVLLASQFLFAFVHAVVLPTYHIDSLTNWTMRAKVSWLDSELAFDPTEVRGVAKPQYPFLVHGVQMAANVVASDWRDRAANSATFLLSVSTFCSLFLLLRRLRGTTIALVGVAAITHIPLLSFHLAQGYGDIHLVTYLLLSLGFVLAARITQDARWYLASALFVAASAWTKTEGLVIGLLPWLLLVGVDLPWPVQRKHRIAAMVCGLVLSLLFPLFLLLKGLPFTPHASDSALGFHPEVVGLAFAGFFSPSMGLSWVTIAIALMVVARRRNFIALGWGSMALGIVLATYLFTPNARFLLNGESYYRQLMVPAALFILAIVASVQGSQTRDTEREGE